MKAAVKTRWSSSPIASASAPHRDHRNRHMWRQDWDSRTPESFIRSNIRGLSANVLLILSQAPGASQVDGYRTWQRLGRQVRAGEKGIAILAPCRYRAAATSVVRPRATTGSDGGAWIPGRSCVRPIIPTDGPPIAQPGRPALLQGQAPDGLWDALAAQVADTGYVLESGDCAGANGRTSFDARTVRIRADVDDTQAVKTLCHALLAMSSCTTAPSTPPAVEARPRSRPRVSPTWSASTPAWPPTTTRSLSPDSRVLTRPWLSAGFHRHRTPYKCRRLQQREGSIVGWVCGPLGVVACSPWRGDRFADSSWQVDCCRHTKDESATGDGRPSRQLRHCHSVSLAQQVRKLLMDCQIDLVGDLTHGRQGRVWSVIKPGRPILNRDTGAVTAQSEVFRGGLGIDVCSALLLLAA
jgi:hypothetical protein